jgi:glycosyltransferase involved in cell wall biosynthesis
MFALQTVKMLNQRGIESELLCFPESKIHQEAVLANIRVHQAKLKNYFHPIELLKLIKFLQKSKFDLVHSHASKDLWSIVPSLFFSKNKIPLLLSKQMGSYIVKKDLLHKLIYKRVHFALAISRVIEKNLLDTTPLTKEKIQLLHNAIDTKYFDPSRFSPKPVRVEFGIDDNEILIGMIARFSPGKGHEEFLLAAEKLIAKYRNLKFLIVGEPSKGEDYYVAEIKKLALRFDNSNKIIFTGFRKDTPEILSAMDIFVFPSHAEAFGIALAEALSMGKPTICSNSDGVLDIAVDGVTSYLFEKRNWKDLFEKIDKLIQNPVVREEFGIAGRKRAVEMFDIEVYTSKLIDIYCRALQKN